MSFNYQAIRNMPSEEKLILGQLIATLISTGGYETYLRDILETIIHEMVEHYKLRS